MIMLTFRKFPEFKSFYSDEHDVWNRVGFYLGTACANLVLLMSLQKIIIGGGVMNRELLYPLIRKHCAAQLNGYIAHSDLETATGLENIIVKPSIEKDLGIIAAAIVGADSEDTI
jgi:fructokinase